MTHFLWRLLGPDGSGIYQDPDLIGPHSPYRDGSNPKRPGPAKDHIPAKYQGKFVGPFQIEGGAFFAFPSVGAARKWFDKASDLAKWAAKGAKLVAIPCDHAGDVFTTAHQAVYYPKGEPVLTLPADSLYALTPEQLEAKATEADHAVV